jgi:phage-related protein
MTIPNSIAAQAHSLNPDDLHTLLKIEIFPVDGSASVMMYLTDQQTLVFGGNTYESMGFQLIGAGLDAGGEKSRPRLQLPNPGGMFSVFTQNGDLETSRVDRYFVHPSDLSTATGMKSMWYVSRVESVSSALVVLELAALSDGPKVKLPARTYMYPEFRSVRI